MRPEIDEFMNTWSGAILFWIVGLGVASFAMWAILRTADAAVHWLFF